MTWVPTDPFRFLADAIIVMGLLLSGRRMIRGPSPVVREQIEIILRAKHIELVELKTRWGLQIGRSSRIVLIARGRDVFGGIQTFYFDVDFWAEALTRRPRIRELGQTLSPSRFFG